VVGKISKSWGSRYNISTSPYWVYGGNNSCSRLFMNHMEIVEVVAMSIFHDYPEAFDRRLSMGDACPSVGNCPRHPGGSHGTLCSFDSNYYTLDHSNTTQYRPGTKTDDINVVTQMWKTGEGGKVLLPNIFDWERNFVFFYRLRQIFSRCTIGINYVLRETIIDGLKTKYNLNMMSEVCEFIHVNVGMTYNHHTHAHINLSNKINIDFNVQDFIKLHEKTT